MRHKLHPLNFAAERLQQIGIMPARIQGFTEEAGVSGRQVCLTDPDGAYYQFGFDMPNCPDEDREKIQVIFLRCPERAVEIASMIGWRLDLVEMLPVVGPVPAGVKFVDSTPSAIFSLPVRH